MKQAGVDVAVLLMFFCRPEQFACVFEQVRAARPSRLYLHQDGPRPNRSDDLEGIMRCREIAAQVDWECDVHTLYHDSNIGCGPSQHIAERWLFENEEMGIVLEDDIVPSQSFFHFCAELLERYKDDERIDRICGMNQLGTWGRADSSYFFAVTGSIWGWASWRRVVSEWDSEYTWLDDPRAVRQAGSFLNNRRAYRWILTTAEKRRAMGQPFHETAGGFAQLLNSRLMIVPTRNLVTCIGVSANASHAPDDARTLPHRVRRLFDMQRHEIEFPLSHPKYVLRDTDYEHAISVSALQDVLDRLETIWLTAVHEGPQEVLHRARRSCSRRFGRNSVGRA